jgi:hypothetical protein
MTEKILTRSSLWAFFKDLVHVRRVGIGWSDGVNTHPCVAKLSQAEPPG